MNRKTHVLMTTMLFMLFPAWSCTHRTSPPMVSLPPPPSPRASDPNSSKVPHVTLTTHNDRMASVFWDAWFTAPYSYMFTGTSGQSAPLPLPLSRGRFCAGTQGMTAYANAFPILRQVGRHMPYRRDNDFITIDSPEASTIFRKVASIPLITATSDSLFSHINPRAIKWAYVNLIPSPEVTIKGVKASVIYREVFSRTVHLYARVYMNLHARGLQQEASAYMAAARSGTEMLEWLKTRYAPMDVSGGSYEDDATCVTAHVAAGFWLRRYADHSIATLVHCMYMLLLEYDRPFLDSLGPAGHVLSEAPR